MGLKKTADYLVMGAIAFNLKRSVKFFFEHNRREVCPDYGKKVKNERKRGFWEGKNGKIEKKDLL